MTTSSTLENNSETAEPQHTHDHAEEAHDHDHAHGPVLNPDCTRELVIDVPAEEVSRAWATVAANYRKYAKIPGFRAGKVPESVVRRRFGAEIRKEVIDSLLPERFNKGVADLGIRPVGQPQVTELTVDEGQPLHVKAVFEYLPSFSIDGYKDVTVAKPSVEVSDEEFKHEVDHLRDSRATIEPVEEDRALVDGDWAQISYKGEIQKDATEAAAEGAAEEQPVSGEDTLVEIGGKDTVDAFNSALRGAKPGQELKVEVIYPADYAESKLAGKTVAYEVTVKGIKKRILPELNDEFAKELGHYESYADLEKSVREYMENRKRRSVESETKDRLFAALSEKFTFAVPESLVQDQIDTRLERGLRALAAQGMSSEQMRKLDFARLRAAQRDSAVAEVKANVLLDRIAGEENITVSEEEMDKELQIAAIQSREPLDALKVRLTKEGGLARIGEQLRREKTASILYERLPA
ncbi:MAG: trigger factor [Terracidiphilus sp.]|nr:trigger factor [Terracidiphilus sp.]MDR3796837.1 trigger factor [Terracidiphilus sp.]